MVMQRVTLNDKITERIINDNFSQLSVVLQPTGSGGGIGAGVGSGMVWFTETPPLGWLECDGRSLLRVNYLALFNVIGYTYGSVDVDHFNLPDLRGVFPRGWDHGKGSDPDASGRTNRGDGITGDHVGTKQAEGVKQHLHTIPNTLITTTSLQPSAIVSETETNLQPDGFISGVNSGNYGGNETRPININVMFIIKVE